MNILKDIYWKPRDKTSTIHNHKGQIDEGAYSEGWDRIWGNERNKLSEGQKDGNNQ